jgi:HEPN domain-containing protein/predicted nucleotidyltransferase
MSVIYEVNEGNKALYNDRTLTEWLPVVIGDLVCALDPVRIYLFGSIAQGCDGPDSDLDLLVVVARIEDASEVPDLMVEARRVITAPVPCDVLVTDTASFEAYKDNPWYVYQQIVEEGSLVYEREPWTTKEETINAHSSGEIGDSAKFLESAKEDLWYANLGKDKHRTGAAFHAQQAAENALKALLITEAEGFPKTRDLVALVERLPPRYVEAFDLGALSELNPWAMQGRYPADMPSITTGVMERLLATATSTVETVTRLVADAVIPPREIQAKPNGRTEGIVLSSRLLI